MKVLFLTVLLLIPVTGETSEADIVNRECKGKVEYVLPDRTRIDCLTDQSAIEFDYAKKWYECITQAMHYAMWARNEAVCVLILNRPGDVKYVERANALILHYRLPVRIETVNE